MSIRGSPVQNKAIKQNISTRPSKSVRTHSEKKLSKENKSFTWNQSEKGLNSKPKNSFTHLQSRNKSLKSKNFKSIKKFLFKEATKKNLLSQAETEIQKGDYKSALAHLCKFIKEEPSNPTAIYSRGKCYISAGSYKEAIPDLLNLVQDFPKFDKNAYVALAMCFVAVNEYQTAIRQLTKALERFPKFKSAYLARGQLFTHSKIWDKAIADFYTVISAWPEDGAAYIGLSEVLISMGDKQNALKVLNSAAKCRKTSSLAYLKRGKIFYDSNNFKKSLKELNKSIQVSPLEAESYYYKALAQLNLGNLTEAALSLEQVVKYDHSKSFTGAAIYDLGAIKIKQKDYYGAMHTFQRATDLNVEIKEQKVLVRYVESILTLMKRKFKEGSQVLSEIIKKNSPIIQEYIGNCYCFRAYAYAAQELHEKAVRDLETAGKIQKIDSASEYNYLVSQSILAEKLEISLKLLEEAKGIYPKNPEPFAYRGLYFALQKDWNRARAELTVGISLKPNDSDFHFFRGIVNYCEEVFEECIKDLDIAVDKAEDHNLFHYFCRGLCYANLGFYTEAMNDFSAVVHLNDCFPQGYLYHGRCALLKNNANQAFTDYQKLLFLNPEDPKVHVHAGDLLYLTGSYEDALKAYKNSISKSRNKEAFIQRARCHIALENLKPAIEDLSEALSIEHDKKVLQDLNILKAIEIGSNGQYRDSMKLLKDLKSEFLIPGREVKKFLAVIFFYLEDFSSVQSLLGNLQETQEDDTVEIIYNLAVKNIVSQYYEAALSQLNELAYMVDGIDRGKLLFLIGYLNLALEDEKQGKEYIEEAFKYDKELVSSFLKQGKVTVLPFKSSDFSNSFPLKQVKVGKATPIFIRPSFRLPKANPPFVEFPFEECILAQFQLKRIKCKPEAPWLNRVKGMIQFTDEVQIIVSESVTESVDEEGCVGEEDVLEENSEYQKYRSALCLPRGSDEILKSMQEVLKDEE